MGTDYFKLRKEANEYADGEEKENADDARNAIKLANYIIKSTPVFEAVLEENLEFANLENPKAKNMKSYEERIKFKLPEVVLSLLDASLVKVNQLTAFDSAPQNKIAIAYVLKRNSDESSIFLTIVYNVWNGEPSRFLVTSDEVTSISAPLEYLVICGTNIGSLCVFDL